MLKTAYVKVPIFNKTKNDIPLCVIWRQALSNFLKVNRSNKICVIRGTIDYDPAERKYCIAIQFHF